MKRLLRLPALLGAFGLCLSASVAQQPDEEFGNLRLPGAPAPAAKSALPTGVVPVAPAKTAAPRAPMAASPYPLTKEAGAWMVCVATYVGPDGASLAKQVADHLRDKHRLDARILNRGDEERKKIDDEHAARQKMYPGVQLRKRGYRVEDQFAVMVGGFKDMAAAAAALPKIKELSVPPLKTADGRSPYDLITIKKGADAKTGETVRMHPYHKAMVVRNPTVPVEKEAAKTFDPFWTKLNAGEEYSLLKNPKKFTLLVKEFNGGGSRFAQAGAKEKDSGGILSAIGLGGESPADLLGASAMQAHALAELLRNPKFGLHAYVMHTRTASLVTVGGFTGLDDPAMARMQQQLAQLKFSTAKGGGVDPVGLLPQPIPMMVPRP